MKRVRWENVRGPRAVFSLVVATALGAGLIPLAPGTWGTLVAVPIVFATAAWAWPAKLALWGFLALLGTWAAKVFDETMESSDNQSIVIDEVVGLGITAWTAGTYAPTLIAAFVLFRFFDIVKPPPIRQVDRWSKKKAAAARGGSASSAARHDPTEKFSSPTAKTESRRQMYVETSGYWGGFGVMADDILAGFEALAVVLVLQAAHVLPG